MSRFVNVVHCSKCHLQVIRKHAYMGFYKDEPFWATYFCFEHALQGLKNKTLWFDPYNKRKLRRMAKGLHLL
jgi:hypothetical protein